MNDATQQLKTVLQLLALPVIGQVYLVEDDCTRVNRLARAYNTAHHSFREGDDQPVAREQLKVLDRLGDQLAGLRADSASSLCSELALRTSHDWQQVRLMARAALVRFNWTLAIPSREVFGRELGFN